MPDEQAPEKIIINGQEIDPEEATQLIELGNKYRKIESDLNTSLDKVYPEYTRTSQELKQTKADLAERTLELERIQKSATQPKVDPNSDMAQIRKAAREVGLADEDYLNEKGYMTRDQVEAMLTEKQNLQKAADEVLSQARTLEREIDGSDGRQPFNPDAVMAYAYVNNISDLRDAYDKMNDKYNAKWKEQQIDAQAKPGLTTLTPGGKKEPQRTKLNNDNLGAALGDWLGGLPEE